MIAIIDYGIGNLRSVQKAFEKVGAKAFITDKSDDILRAQKVVLPGVGAMRPAMERLNSLHLIPTIKNAINSGKPFLGICLGLQLLFEESMEGGKVEGLGVLKGNVIRFEKLKVPHMGWNQIQITNSKCSIFKNIPDSAHVYFCHSYFVTPKDNSAIAATTDYGVDFVSAVGIKNIFGVQFHPEKSQLVGLAILKNFKELAS